MSICAIFVSKAYHGVMEQERIAGNDYVVNLRIKYPMEQAMLSDDVEDTLNYANVFEIISQRDVCAKQSFGACSI